LLLTLPNYLGPVHQAHYPTSKYYRCPFDSNHAIDPHQVIMIIRSKQIIIVCLRVFT